MKTTTTTQTPWYIKAEYDRAYAVAQAGGMNETDCDSFAKEQAELLKAKRDEVQRLRGVRIECETIPSFIVRVRHTETK